MVFLWRGSAKPQKWCLSKGFPCGEAQPAAVVLENVLGMAKVAAGEDSSELDRFLAALRCLNYHVKVMKVSLDGWVQAQRNRRPHATGLQFCWQSWPTQDFAAASSSLQLAAGSS